MADKSYEISTEKLVDLVTAQATEKINRRIEGREQRRLMVISVIVAIIAAIGIGSVYGFVGLYIREQVRNQLTSTTSDYTQLLRFETAYQEFVTLSLSVVDEREQLLSPTILESVMQLLREIAESKNHLTGRETFVSHLLPLVEALTSRQGQERQINELDALFRKELQSNSEALSVLAQHYGRTILGSALPLEGQSEESVARLRAYADAARERGIQKDYLIWRALLAFQESGSRSNRVTDELVKEIESLSEQEQLTLYRALFELSEPEEFRKNPTQEDERVAQVVRDFAGAYPSLNNGMDRVNDAAVTKDEEVQDGSQAIASILEAVVAITAGRRGADFYLANALEEIGDNWVPVGTMMGELGDGSEVLRPANSGLDPEKEYMLQGACDERCLDLDLAILVDGEVLESDSNWDAVPSVVYSVPQTGTPAVRVTMFNCSAPTCGYSIAVLENSMR